MVQIPEKEMQFTHSRSQGSGGQNVNKVNTRVELRFNIGESETLSEEQKEKIRKRLENRISRSDELIVTLQATRSQLKNKEIAMDRFQNLINSALIPVKKRKKTKPGRAAVEKRLKQKKLTSEKKANRKNPEL
jgi:ribosome-associated protein